MASSSNIARMKAAYYEARLKEADDDQAIHLFTTLSDFWKRAAKNWELLDALEASALSAADESWLHSQASQRQTKVAPLSIQ